MSDSLFGNSAASCVVAAKEAHRGGFDCILGNPPWEMVQLDPAEFFSAIRPDIAALPTMAAKQRAIVALQTTDPELHQRYLDAMRRVHAAQSFFHGSGRYPLTTRGRLNLAPLFAEAVRDSVSDTGQVGLVVPSGIATDSFTQFFFQDLVDRASLVSLFDFENAAPLFEGVHRSYKFSCLTLRAPATDEKATAKAAPAEFVFFAHRVEDIVDERRRFTLTREEIALVNPNTKTCPIFRTKVDAELTKFIYRRVPVLLRKCDGVSPDINPWGFSGQLMFMMNTASHLFRTHEQLEKDGWKLRGNVFERGAERYLPLYEAKMVHHFDHRWATYEGADTRDTTEAERADASRVSLPRYWVPAVEVQARLAGRWDREWLLGWRDICRSTDERTVIAGVFPRCAVGNKIPLMLNDGLDSVGAACLSACLTAFAFDFPSRQKIGGTSLNFFIYEQLPVLAPEAFGHALGTQLWKGLIPPRVLELSATADDMSPFSKDLWPEGDGAVFRYDPERRFEIRCELDAAFFHLYLGTPEEWSRTASPELLKSLPTPRDAVAYIMDTFPIVKRKDEEAHGHYRTKDRILALYDELQRCFTAGQPFKSTLNPPPGPPTNPDGTFAKLPPWPKGAPKPATWPAHIHPPVLHRS